MPVRCEEKTFSVPPKVFLSCSAGEAASSSEHSRENMSWTFRDYSGLFISLIQIKKTSISVRYFSFSASLYSFCFPELKSFRRKVCGSQGMDYFCDGI
jgi:hypothetical protein